MERKIVWEFTNQKKLTKSEFIDYFERKVFRTIRKYEMLPRSRIITIKKSNNLNTKVLEHILEKKFEIEHKQRALFSDENASDVAEEAMKNVLMGKMSGPTPAEKTKRPLYYLSDKETELYAKLVGIKGLKKKRDKKVEVLLKKFSDKNQDLEQNILKAISQLE